MMRNYISLPAVAMLAAFCGSSAVAAEKPISLKEMPTAVRQAIEGQVASTGAKIKTTTVEIEKGRTIYECESVRPNGKRQDFEVDAMGTLGEVEDTVELSDLPSSVKATVDKAVAGVGTIKELVSVTVNGKLTGYGATVVKNGKVKEYEMNLAGSLKED